MHRFEYKNIIAMYSNDKGATSILIIFMMIVLITFGMLSITSANVNLKLGKSDYLQNRIFYSIDGDGEKYIRDIDYSLAKAKKQADLYLEQKIYLEMEHENIHKYFQAGIYNLYIENKKDDNIYKKIFDNVYMHFAKQNLDLLIADYHNMYITYLKEGEYITGITIKNEMTAKEDDKTKLNIAIAVNPITINTDASDNNSDKQEKRYTIQRWEQSREPFEYKNFNELWDGRLK